jgi:hypothetical protein
MTLAELQESSTVFIEHRRICRPITHSNRLQRNPIKLSNIPSTQLRHHWGSAHPRNPTPFVEGGGGTGRAGRGVSTLAPIRGGLVAVGVIQTTTRLQLLTPVVDDSERCKHTGDEHHHADLDAEDIVGLLHLHGADSVWDFLRRLEDAAPDENLPLHVRRLLHGAQLESDVSRHGGGDRPRRSRDEEAPEDGRQGGASHCHHAARCFDGLNAAENRASETLRN